MPGAARFAAAPGTKIAVPGSSVETTVLQIGTDSTHICRITEAGISFDDTTADIPVLCLIRSASTIITGASVASQPFINTDPGSALVASGYGLSANIGPTSYPGVITGSNIGIIRAWLISPTAGLGPVQWPQDREPVLRPGVFYQLSVSAPVAVNCIPYFEVEV